MNEPKESTVNIELPDTFEKERSKTASSKNTGKDSKQKGKVVNQTKKKTTKQTKSKQSQNLKAKSGKKPIDTASVQSAKPLSDPTRVIKVLFEEVLNLQRMWLDMSSKQAEVTLRLVSEFTGVKNDSLISLMNAIKKNADNFIELQKQWTEVLTKQISEITVEPSYSVTLRKNTENFLDGISQTHNAWADFIKKQTESFGEAIKKRLPAETGLPKTVDIVDSLLKNLLETQKRWVEMATGLFSEKERTK